MGTCRRTLCGARRLLDVALLVLLASLAPRAVQAGPHAPPLGALLGDAQISAATKPFPAPSFSVADLAGGKAELDRLRGKVVLLYFWTTW
jgi:hypothetical protein